MTKSEYNNYEEDRYDIGSVDTHMHSDQVRVVRQLLSGAPCSSSHTRLSTELSDDPPDPLPVSGRNSEQIPQLMANFQT